MLGNDITNKKKRVTSVVFHCYYTVKKGLLFSHPQFGISLTNLSLAGNNQSIPRQGEFNK
jgi:hypothetical protein